MAPETAMDASAAIDTLREVRGHRERLTSQAAGFIWMVWGLVLLGIGLASQATFIIGRHAGYHIGWMDPLTTILFTAAGLLITQVVQKMMAIDTGRPAWQIWAIGAGAIVIMGTLLMASNSFGQFGPVPALMMAPLGLLGMAVAIALSIAMRKQVTMVPGLIAAGFLLIVFLNARFATFAAGPGADLLGNGLLNLINLGTFLGVGYYLVRRG